MSVLPRILFLGVLVGAPWIFGAVQPQWQFRLSAAVVGLLLWRLGELLCLRRERTSPLTLPTACLPLLVLLLLGTIQLLPRQSALESRMEHAVFPEYAADVSAASVTPAGTVSPSTTRSATARLCFVLAVFLLASEWFVVPPFAWYFCWSLALSGTALSFFGIVQKLSWNGQMFWTIPLTLGGTPFASYVNRNNAAGCLNLFLAGTLGLAVLVFRRDETPGRPIVRRSNRHHPWKLRLLGAIARIEGSHLAVVTMIGVTVAAICFSLSRGGVIAMLLGFVAVGLMASRLISLWTVLGLLVLVGLSAVGLLSWLDQWELVDERLATLLDPAGAASGRLQHWKDTLGAVRDFPWFGTGLGTYRYANQPYQARTSHAWYYNADNQFFEVLVEGGLVGLLAFVSLFALTGLAAISLLRRRGAVEHQALGVVGLFAVTTQAVQSMSDFGLIIPANGLLFAAIAGTTCGMACGGNVPAATPGLIRLWQWQSPVLRVGLQVALTIAAGLFLVEMHATTRAELARDADESFDPETTRLAQVDAELDVVQQALQLRPDDPELHRTAAMIYIGRYRLRAYQALRAASDESTMRPADLWRATSLGVLFTRAAEYEANSDVEALATLRSYPEIAENLIPALAHLRTAQQLCPLIRDATLQVAFLAFLLEGSPEDRLNLAIRHVKGAVFVAPSTPDRLFEAGLVADSLGQAELAETTWQRCLVLSEKWTRFVWNAAMSSRPSEVVLGRVIPPDPGVLVKLAEELRKGGGGESAEGVSAVITRATEVLQNATSSESAPPDVRARFALLRGNKAEAIDWYRAAISHSLQGAPNRLENDWRLTLAQLLLDEQRFEEAFVEYSLARRLTSNRKQIEQIDRKVREVQRAQHLSGPNREMDGSKDREF